MNKIIEHLPHRRMEAWRWSDVRGRVNDDLGGLSQAAVPEFNLPEGLSVSRTQNLVSDHPMAGLASRFAEDAYTVTVPENFKSDDSLNIDFSRPGHVRVHIKLGQGARLDLNELYCSGGRMFSNVDIHIDLAAGAHLSRKIFNQDEAQVVRVVTANISLWRSAEFTQHALSFGAALARIESRFAVLGKDVRLNVDGAYLLSGGRHVDMTSHVDIGATDAMIRQTVKGVVTDTATGVFQGKFHVRRPAQHTDAEMRHDALMLSDKSHVKAKPELEIYADDVACAHGNTIGALDESALFYMRQRGIPLKTARALLTEAFAAQAFDGMKEIERNNYLEFVRTWLEAH